MSLIPCLDESEAQIDDETIARARGMVSKLKLT